MNYFEIVKLLVQLQIVKLIVCNFLVNLCPPLVVFRAIHTRMLIILYESIVLSQLLNKNLSYRRDSARCGNGHSWSIEVIRCCANRCGICDFILALNNNLNSIFNRSWDISPSLHFSCPTSLPARRNWKKLSRSKWTCFGIRVTRTLDYPTINLKCIEWSQCMPVPHRQTDGRTLWQQHDDSF